MRRRRGGLSPEDRDLWSRYARTAEPLHPARRADPVPPPQAPLPPAPEAPPPVAPFQVGERARARTSTRAAVSPAMPAPLRMDAKAHRRMRAGKLRPEAKLDLHGMTLDAAHPALARFVLRAQGQGLRLVIVVTGKGKTKAEKGLWTERPGVLRRQVPIWLALPPLAAVVLQVTEAHRSHGGGGAFYVYLRRG